MGSIFSYKDFVVKFKQAYNNEKSVGGIDLLMNVDNDNVKYINRECVVVGLPFNYDGKVKVGDTLIVHHNIARISLSNSSEKTNQNRIRKDLYRVPDDLVFLYRSSDKDEWKSYGEYCFVKPIENTVIEKIGSIFIPNVDQEKFVSNTGVVCIENDLLLEMGVKKGDKVYFKNWSEHKYELDNELYYKMNIDRVLGLFIE